MKCFIALMTVLFAVPALADTYPEGGWRHARLEASDGTQISIDFLRVRVANGGSSAIQTQATQIWFNLYPRAGGSDCGEYGPIELVFSNIPGRAPWNAVTRSINAFQINGQSCRYSGQLAGELPISQAESGELSHYRQTLQVKVKGRAIQDSFKPSDTFELQLDSVPEND